MSGKSNRLFEISGDCGSDIVEGGAVGFDGDAGDHAADVDVLIPAALENQLTEKNAAAVRAKLVVEAANGPTTVEADRILEQNGACVVPDILANAGGVVVSYFEWVQNIQSLMWDKEEINRMLEKIMIRAFNEVWAAANQHAATMRMGAYMVALSRIAKAKKIRGIFP